MAYCFKTQCAYAAKSSQLIRYLLNCPARDNDLVTHLMLVVFSSR